MSEIPFRQRWLLAVACEPRINTSRAALCSAIVIADHAGADGSSWAWPSMGTIAERTGFSRRNIHAGIDRLGDAGYLAVDSHAGRVSHYRLHLPDGDPCIGPPVTCDPGITAPVIQGSQHVVIPGSQVHFDLRSTDHNTCDPGITTPVIRASHDPIQDPIQEPADRRGRAREGDPAGGEQTPTERLVERSLRETREHPTTESTAAISRLPVDLQPAVLDAAKQALTWGVSPAVVWPTLREEGGLRLVACVRDLRQAVHQRRVADPGRAFAGFYSRAVADRAPTGAAPARPSKPEGSCYWLDCTRPAVSGGRCGVHPLENLPPAARAPRGAANGAQAGVMQADGSGAPGGLLRVPRVTLTPEEIERNREKLRGQVSELTGGGVT